MAAKAKFEGFGQGAAGREVSYQQFAARVDRQDLDRAAALCGCVRADAVRLRWRTLRFASGVTYWDAGQELWFAHKGRNYMFREVA